MQFKSPVSLNPIDLSVPLLKGHCGAGLLVGRTSFHLACVYIISRSVLPKHQSTCKSPGVVKMWMMPGVGQSACISLIRRCDGCWVMDHTV